MKQRQINSLEMMEATNGYLDTHSAVWSAIPIINTYKNSLSQLITDITLSAQEQGSAQVFIGGSLRELKKNIAGKIDILDDTLEAFADDTGNEEVRVQAANSATDYFRLSNEEFELKTQQVISLLETHVADMADYGMTTAQIDDVKLSFDNYQAQRGTPRSYQIASKVATQNLDDLFDEAMTYTNKLDKVMKRFKRSNSPFYNGYQAARLVIDN